MNLPKAIEIITQMTKDTDPLGILEMVDALKLGIEALKAIKKCRYYPLPNSLKHLPGETEE